MNLFVFHRLLGWGARRVSYVTMVYFSDGFFFSKRSMVPNQSHQFGDDMESIPHIHSHAQTVVPHLTLHPGMMKTGPRDSLFGPPTAGI